MVKDINYLKKNLGKMYNKLTNIGMVRKINDNLHWHLGYTLKEDSSAVIDKKDTFNLNVIIKLVLSILKLTI